MGDGPNDARPVPQAHPGRHRRLAAPARRRLRRPLPDPPLGPGDADRGDAWRRCTTSCGPARPATSARRACTRGSSRRRSTRPAATAGPVRVDAEPLQPGLPRGGAGDDAALRATRASASSRGARSPAACSPATGAAAASGAPPARPTRPFGDSCTPRTTSTSSTPTPRSPASARRHARRRWRWPGCCTAGRHRPDRRRDEADHLDDAIAATELTLDEKEIERLEAPYVPHPVLGHDARRPALEGPAFCGKKLSWRRRRVRLRRRRCELGGGGEGAVEAGLDGVELVIFGGVGGFGALGGEDVVGLGRRCGRRR